MIQDNNLKHVNELENDSNIKFFNILNEMKPRLFPKLVKKAI